MEYLKVPAYQLLAVPTNSWYQAVSPEANANGWFTIARLAVEVRSDMIQ